MHGFQHLAKVRVAGSNPVVRYKKLDLIQWTVMSVCYRRDYGSSDRRSVWQASTSKSASACKIDRPARIVMLAMRQSMSFLTVSPLWRQIRYSAAASS